MSAAEGKLLSMLQYSTNVRRNVEKNEMATRKDLTEERQLKESQTLDWGTVTDV